MNPLLAGIRILDLSRLLPGPFCTQYFAQLGAEVIKIEEPQGEFARGLPEMFTLINRGKRSVVMDLRQPDSVALLKRMVADADVLIESFRPGVMGRLGLAYETLREINPRLVYAALTGYGQTGPYADRAGHDMNYLGYAGVLDQIGAAGGPPVLCNVQIADLAGGALTCAVGVLAAIIGARASGEGSFVDCSMLDGTLALQALAVSSLRANGRAPQRGADMLTGALPNYSLYECADGKHVALGALEPKFFTRFCQLVERPELLQLPPQQQREQLVALFKTRTRDEWEQALGDQDCCACGVFTVAEALDNPQVRARGLWSEVDGKPAFDFPIRYSNAQTRRGTTARLGADTEAVLGPLRGPSVAGSDDLSTHEPRQRADNAGLDQR